MGRNLKNSTEAELAVLLAEGDKQAFEEIYKRYYPLLYRHAMAMLKEHELSQDVIQDVFFFIWEKRFEINIKSTLSGYLYGTTRFMIIDRIKQSKFKAEYLNSLEKEIDRMESTTENTILEDELRQKIEKEIKLLPEKMRAVFTIGLNNDYTISQQAELLNLSEQTVKNQRHKALQKLRLKLGHLMLSLF